MKYSHHFCISNPYDVKGRATFKLHLHRRMQEINSVLIVNAVKDVPFSYPFCVICLRKIHLRKNQRWNCAYCGNWQRDNQVQHRYRIAFNVTDGQRLADVTVFGKSLEKIFGETADQFNKYLANLESVLFEKELSVKQVLLHAAQQVFCGSTFCFTFTVPLKQSKSQTHVNLKWLETRITGGLIAKRISFAINDCEGYPTVKGALQYFSEKLASKAKMTDIEAYLFESSYFSNSNKEVSAEKTVCKRHLEFSTFCESVEFCSPGVTNLDIFLSESKLSRNQLKIHQTPSLEKRTVLDSETSQYEEYLRGSSCLSWMDSDSLLMSSTPLSIIGSAKNQITKNLHSMSRDSKCFQIYDDDFFNTKFEKNNEKAAKFNEDGTRRHKKCFKALLPFYQSSDDKIQTCWINSDCLISSPSENDDRSCQKNALTPVHSEKSIESISDSLMLGQIRRCSFVTDSALSPDIFS